MGRVRRRLFQSMLGVMLVGVGLLSGGCGFFQQPENPAPPAIGLPEFAQSDTGPAIPARLVLPTIDLDTPVVELGWHPARSNSGLIFSQWDVAEYAAGWHKNSSLPAEGGNVVLSAHNNILGSIFRELDQLKKGDQAILYSNGRPVVYEVDRVMIVPETNATPEQRAQNVSWIEPTGDARLTLVSCWPRDDNTHRIIVVAHPVSPKQLSQN
ncbi:MAG: sortase [Caldilineaceae bacterium]|nr:sortase [Caldilineaceae bacterium]